MHLIVSDLRCLTCAVPPLAPVESSEDTMLLSRCAEQLVLGASNMSTAGAYTAAGLLFIANDGSKQVFLFHPNQ